MAAEAAGGEPRARRSEMKWGQSSGALRAALRALAFPYA